MTRTELDALLARREAVRPEAERLGDLYEALEKLLLQAKVSHAAHASAIYRLIRVYGRDNVERMLNVLANDMKGEY